MNQTFADKIGAIVRSGLKAELNRPWEAVLHMARRYAYPKRARINFSGAMYQDFYYISEGRVCLQSSSFSGREHTANYFGPGSLFNLATVFIGDLKEEQHGTWVALDDVVLWRFPGSILHDQDFVREHPGLIINLMQGMCLSIFTQFSWTTGVYLADPLPRLARYLLGLADAAGKLDFAPGVTQQQAATYLGMHRGTLSNALKQLREQNIVREFTRKRLRILDAQKLKEFTTF